MPIEKKLKMHTKQSILWQKKVVKNIEKLYRRELTTENKCLRIFMNLKKKRNIEQNFIDI